MKNFSYNILQYCHSPFKEERLNVALLFFFPLENRIFFVYPKKFKHLRELYSDFSERNLLNALKAIQTRAKSIEYELNNLLFKEEFTPQNLHQLVLAKDSTALWFLETESAVSNLSLCEEIVLKTYRRYFSNLESIVKRVRHDEGYILRDFRSKLFSLNNAAQYFLKKDITIQDPRTSVRFEYIWENGVTNLIKPISFDLEDESSINDKAILNYTRLGFISETLKKNQAFVHLLIAEPKQDSGIKVQQAYKIALELLHESKAPVQIIDEYNFDDYVNYVANNIHEPKMSIGLDFLEKVNQQKKLPPPDQFLLL